MPLASSHISSTKDPISGQEALLAAPHCFTFNGKECTDEIAGTGNHNTALFWDYDSRLARRWNADPVVKENESPYLTLNGNPIIQVDTLGSSATRYEVEDGNEIKTTNDVLDNKIIVVLDEQRELFEIWMKIDNDKGFLYEDSYNNSLADELSREYNQWQIYSADNFVITLRIQIGTQTKLGPTTIEGKGNIASYNLYPMSNVQIGDYKSFVVNYFGEDGQHKIQHDDALSGSVGFGSVRQKTGFGEGRNANDGRWSNRAQFPFVEIQKIERANTITIIYMFKQSASEALGLKTDAGIGRGLIKKTIK